MAKEIVSAGHEVTILTAIPNYPTGKLFKDYEKKSRNENIDGVNIRRHWLYPSNSSNPFIRIFSMLSFSISLLSSALWLRSIGPSKVIVQSPPLLVGLTGVLLGRFAKSHTILNVSDIWPHTAVDLGVMNEGSLSFKFFSWIEGLMYKYSDDFICQAASVKSYLESKTTSKNVFLYRNLSTNSGIDKKIVQKQRTEIVYAGLLGIAQGVLDICKAVNFGNLGCIFHIYGDGAQREDLEVLAQGREDIFLHPSVSKEEMQKRLLLYDATLIPLSTHIRGAMPSKVYMAISAQLPIFFHGIGEGSETVEAYDLGFISSKNDFTDLAENIRNFSLMSSERRDQLTKSIKKASEREFNYSRQQLSLIQYLEAI